MERHRVVITFFAARECEGGAFSLQIMYERRRVRRETGRVRGAGEGWIGGGLEWGGVGRVRGERRASGLGWIHFLKT